MNPTDQSKTRPQSRARLRTGARRVWSVLSPIVLVLGALLLGISWWIMAYSGITTVDQAIVNLQGGGGAGAGGTHIVVDGIVWGILTPIVLATLILIAIRKTQTSEWRKTLPRVGQRSVTAVIAVIYIVVPLSGATAISTTLSLPQYVRALTSDQQLDEYYVTPKVAALPDDTAKNLVLIYLESVENALGDDTVFEKDMLHPLKEMTSGWDSVSLTQPANGGWTLGGIVNTQCGFPLKMVTENLLSSESDDVAQDENSYLPGATCLGDILQQQGYRSIYMGGANTSFSGKEDFLTDHGYDTVLGRQEWMMLGETEFREDWGLSDRRLMELAKDRITELHQGGVPFNLTLLTLDTHPDDFVFPYCDVTTEYPLTSIHECSMRQVAEFVGYMDEQGYLEDTIVVIMGDHLRAMGANNAFRDQLELIPDRTIFNRIWSPNDIDWAVSEIDQFSMYPTILELLGFELEDGLAGIGVSALQGNPARDTIRNLPEAAVDGLVQSRSRKFYEDMWQVNS